MIQSRPYLILARDRFCAFYGTRMTSGVCGLRRSRNCAASASPLNGILRQRPAAVKQKAILALDEEPPGVVK